MLKNEMDKEIRYGGFWVRLAASFLDGIITAIFSLAPLAIVMIMYAFSPMILLEDLIWLFQSNLWGVIVGITYTVKLVASMKQSTFAMRWFNLIIVNKNMQRLSLANSFLGV